MADYLEEMVSAIEKTVKGSVSEGLDQVRASLDESAAAVKGLEKSIKSSAVAEVGEHVKTMDERWNTMGANIKTVTETLEEVRDYRASLDKRLSALDKRSGKKTDKILVGVLIALACLALGFAVGFVLNSHWVRQQEETGANFQKRAECNTARSSMHRRFASYLASRRRPVQVPNRTRRLGASAVTQKTCSTSEGAPGVLKCNWLCPRYRSHNACWNLRSLTGQARCPRGRFRLLLHCSGYRL